MNRIKDRFCSTIEAVHRRDACEHKSENGTKWKWIFRFTEKAKWIDSQVKQVEPVADKTKEENEHHDDGNSLATVSLLLLVDVRSNRRTKQEFLTSSSRGRRQEPHALRFFQSGKVPPAES